MNIVLTSGVLTVSVDLELDVQRRGGDQPKSLEIAAGKLVDLVGRYRMPAIGGLWPSGCLGGHRSEF